MCTRIFWNTPQIAKVVGRTCDWETSDEPLLWHFPRGLERNGLVDNAATWTTKYRSLATTFWGAGSSEGINEAGLSAHLLYLASSDFGARDGRPGCGFNLWAQYALDNFATVAEAIAGLEEIQIVQVQVRGRDIGVHLALEDPSGDSAIVEILDGQAVIHHGVETRVMANDPPYNEQLENLSRYKPFGGNETLPGDIISDQRFVRATYYLSHLPEPADELQAVAGVLGIARNVSVPFGAPYDDFVVYPTWWASVTDVTNRGYYFQSTLAPNVIWAEIDSPSLVDSNEVLSLDPTNVELVGDVSSKYQPSNAPF